MAFRYGQNLQNLLNVTLRGLALFRFARGGGKTTFNRQSGCCEIKCSRPLEARYFRRFVGSTS